MDSEPQTSEVMKAPRIKRDEAYYRLRQEVEEFLYDEADMLDERRFGDWLNTLSDDLVYFMPMTFNVKHGQHKDREKTRIEEHMSWFNEGKWTLTKRADQILTGVHWAEEPLSRLSRLVSNVQITACDIVEGKEEIHARSKFVMYQNRCEYEEYYFAGRRRDVLRRQQDGSLKLCRREIDLGQSVLLAKNLTMFF